MRDRTKLNKMSGKVEYNGEIQYFIVEHPEIKFLRDYLKPMIKSCSLRSAIVVTKNNEVYQGILQDGKINWHKAK